MRLLLRRKERTLAVGRRRRRHRRLRRHHKRVEVLRGRRRQGWLLLSLWLFGPNAHAAKQSQNVVIAVTRAAKVVHPIVVVDVVARAAAAARHELTFGRDLDDGAVDCARVHQGVDLAKGHARVGLLLASALCVCLSLWLLNMWLGVDDDRDDDRKMCEGEFV